MGDKSKIERFVGPCDYSHTAYGWWARGDGNALPYCTCVPASPSLAEIENVKLRSLLILAFDQLAKRARDDSDQEILRKIAPEVQGYIARLDAGKHNEMPTVKREHAQERFQRAAENFPNDDTHREQNEMPEASR